MKASKFVTLLLVLILSIFVLMACAPVQAAPVQGVIPIDQVLNSVLTIVMGFASLVGVAALVAVIVNILKQFGIVTDGSAAQWSAALNLIAFIALVAFRVFMPDLTLEILDGYAGQIAMIAVFVLGFIVQMTTSKPVYNLLKQADVPLLSKSFSKR